MDPRFDMSAWDSPRAAASGSSVSRAVKKGRKETRQEDAEEDSQASPGSMQASQLASEEEDAEEEGSSSDVASDDEADGQGRGEEDTTLKVLKPLSKEDLERFERKQRKKGVIYISHLPHGMTVPKVKHLLGSFGEVERIFLQDGTLRAGEKRKRTTAHFTEGWVEFSSKRIAKTVAEMLNAQPIGAAAVTRSSMRSKNGPGKGRNSKRFKDDVWTMKYLPGYKWHMLTEQLANERASRTARLRTELSQSAFEQKDYLRKVERARIMQDKAERRAQKSRREREYDADRGGQLAGGQHGEGSEIGQVTGVPHEAERDGKRVRTFKQRAPVFKDVRDLKDARQVPQQQSAAPRSNPKRAGDAHKQRESGNKQRREGDQALQSVLSSIF